MVRLVRLSVLVWSLIKEVVFVWFVLVLVFSFIFVCYA